MPLTLAAGRIRGHATRVLPVGARPRSSYDLRQETRQMTRKSKRTGRASRRKQDGAVKILAGGMVLTLVPLVMGNTPFGKGLGVLVPLGLFMLTAGVFLMWLNHQKSKSAGEGPAFMDVTEPLPRKARTTPRRDPVLDSPPIEHAGAAQQPAHFTFAAPTEWSSAVFDVIEW